MSSSMGIPPSAVLFRVLTKFPEILARDLRVPEMLENLRPAEDAGFVEQAQAGDEAELLPALGPLFQPRPGFLRRQMPESNRTSPQCSALGSTFLR
jgi:hypothetical protein